MDGAVELLSDGDHQGRWCCGVEEFELKLNGVSGFSSNVAERGSELRNGWRWADELSV